MSVLHINGVPVRLSFADGYWCALAGHFTALYSRTEVAALSQVVALLDPHVAHRAA